MPRPFSPPAYDVLTQATKTLRPPTPPNSSPSNGNDTLGDCTIAAVAHATTTFRGLVSKTPVIVSKQNVVKLYMTLTHGVDSGLNELDVLNYWQSHSVEKDKILAFTKLDPKNHTHVRQAVKLFGGAYIGFQVQQNCVQEFDNHQPWTPGPLTNDGQAVFVTGYDQTGVTVLTWGNTQKATWAWFDECVDEAYALLPPEAAKPNFAPGFDFAQLQADLAAVAN